MSKVDYREILRLKHCDYSQNRISASVRSSHHTVKDVLEAANAKKIHWPLSPDITNQELELILFPDKYKHVSIYVEPDYVLSARLFEETLVRLFQGILETQRGNLSSDSNNLRSVFQIA